MPLEPRRIRRVLCCLLSLFVFGELVVSEISLSGWNVVRSFAVSSPPFIRENPSESGGMLHTLWGQTEPRTADVVGGGSAAGLRVQRPGFWTTVAFEALNSGDEPAELIASFYFRRDPSRQFNRRTWLPPHSRRFTLCPLLVPRLEPPGAHEVICTVMDVTSGTPRVLPDPSGMLQRSILLGSSVDPVTTVMLPAPEAETESFRKNDEAANAAIAARLAGSHTRRINEVSRTLMPDLALSLESMDQLVLSNSTLFSDAATLAAVRQWLFGGGTLWIMLDRTGVAEVGELLGHDWHCSEVGRVDLNEFELQPQFSTLESGGKREFEEPVEFVRVMLEDARVLYRIEGWPAAFVQNFGRGRVIFTTLGAAGWTRHAQPEDFPSSDSLRQAEYVAIPELASLATEMFAARPRNPVTADDLRYYLAKKIGYQIVSRTPVLMILGLFVLTLAVSGVWVWRIGQQPKLAAIAPLLALAAAIPIGAMGMMTQRAIPQTVAIGQVVQVIPQGDSATIRGSLAFYHQTPTSLEVSGSAGGYFVPDRSDQDGTIHEMTWTDTDVWSWSNVRVPASVQTGPFEQSIRLETPCSAEATFTERGLEGRLFGGNWKTLEDPLIVAPGTRGMSARWESDGRFTSGPADLLGPEQFVAARILSDEQQRRQDLLRSVYSRRGATTFPHAPMLLFWSDPIPLPFQFSNEALRTGTALIQVPLTLQRPAADSRVTIPSSFLPFRSVAGPGSRGVAPTYQSATGEWVQSTSASETWLRVRVPEVLLPLRPERLSIHLQINAPSRRLDIVSFRGDRTVVLQSRNQPSGIFDFTIDGPEMLVMDEEGGFLIGLVISEPLTPGSTNAEWKIDDLQLTLDAWVE
jgi:hypothetical protein